MPSTLISPGMVLGRYPERQEPDTGVLDQAAERLWQRFHNQGRFRRAGLRGFVRRVNRHTGALTPLSEQALYQAARQAGYRLRRDGLSPGAAARAFALIREMSGRILKMRHFDAQLMGGWVMINGVLAEMDTGEGKTLTVTLPAAALALAGIRVHVITVNDYLAARDAELMGPLYRALGLSVGSIVEQHTPEQRRVAYGCDITYCSNKQIAFDYLRDRMLLGDRPGTIRLELESLCAGEQGREEKLLMQGLSFAIVDEADSVLIDEARTPLILSRERPGDQQEEIFQQALSLAEKLQQGHDFHIDRNERELFLTEDGRQLAESLAISLGGVWSGWRRREALLKQALSAQYLFHRDRHYLVQDGEVRIIDENTGRIMKDRSWEQGLHQMIEAKEECAITGQRETLSRISYQRFFRRYMGLAGTTGTARETASELHKVYGLQVVAVPTERPSRRRSKGQRILKTRQAKWQAVVRRTQQLRDQGRPVLVGTRSVEDSEQLSELLTEAGLPHQVLSARQDQGEAEIVARAGAAGCITVATNMAGRGTDIPLGKGVVEAGGLHVIATQRNDAWRIDRQLFGRCGRQGDPGSYEMLLSFEDELVADFYTPEGARTLRRLLAWPLPPLPLLARMAMRLPQWAMEQRHRRMRKVFQQTDDQLETLLAFSGRRDKSL